MTRLELLKGSPLDLGFCKIFPFTVGQIAELGENVYGEYCGILTLEIGNPKKHALPEALRNLNTFQLFSLIMKEQSDLREKFLSALRYITRESEIGCINGIFFLGDNFFNEEALVKIKDFICSQNLIKQEEEDYNPADEKAREIQRKLAETKKQVEEIKKRKASSTPEFSDLITGLVFKSNGAITYSSVWDLTYYQFREALERCQLLDNYELNVRQLLAGADPKKIEVKHWLAKIQE